MSDNFIEKESDDTGKLAEIYEQILEKLRAGAERFRAEYSETMREYVTEQKNVLEEIIETVDKAGSSEEHQSALERFLFGANNKEKFQQNLNEYTEHMENIKAINERYADDEDKRKSALFLLRQNRKQSSGFKGDDDEENPNGFVGEMVEGMSDELSDGLTKMLTDFENFETNFKNLGKNLANEMIKISADALMSMIFNEQNAANAIQAIRASYGAIKAVGSGIKGFFQGGWAGAIANVATASKHHSGGIVPDGANVNLPGTDEQLALLKGGGRVLSPGENVEYDRNSGGSNVVFNNFNIKAWDSKDVQKYLLENKQLLNAITFEGIKNNNNHLRTMVRNA